MRLIERMYLVSPVYRRRHPEARSQEEGGRGDSAARELRSAWAKLDSHGGGIMGDREVMRLMREFQDERARLRARESSMRTDVGLQLADVHQSLHALESEVEHLVDQVQASLHKLRAKL